MMRFSLLVVLVLSGAAAGARGQQPGAPDKLGRVQFATSCSEAAAPLFLRGVALLHSFDFLRAIDAFSGAAKADPACAIAFWGIAVSRWGNPFAPAIRPAGQLQQGSDAIARAVTAGAKTARERAYIEAASRLFADHDTRSQAARVAAYRDAMQALATSYPTDAEARIFYALALAFSADPADKSYRNQLEAGRMLQELFAREPEHPGLAHYIIHSFDVPPLAFRALDAARRYATIAPSAPHALHMPSHTFTRVGSWQESIDANIAAAAAAKSEGATAEELHATDYQAYAYLQTGRDRATREVLTALPEIAARFDPALVTAGAPPSAGFFALAAIPARYALERRAWQEAAALTPRPSPVPYADAMTYFARAVGAARLGQLDQARAAIETLSSTRDRLTQAGEAYWAEQVEIQRMGASAWLAFAEGRRSDALAAMRAAAEREDATEKNAVTPGPLSPAREQLGDLLMALEQPAQARNEYEAALTKEPNRFRLVSGAAQAAAAAGDRAAARRHYQALLTLGARADTPTRPEIEEARRFVAAK